MLLFNLYVKSDSIFSSESQGHIYKRNYLGKESFMFIPETTMMSFDCHNDIVMNRINEPEKASSM